MLVWFLGVVCFVHFVLSSAWLLLRGLWLVVYFLLESVGGFGYWAVSVLGKWLGMSEGGGGEVPVVVVVDTEQKKK